MLERKAQFKKTASSGGLKGLVDTHIGVGLGALERRQFVRTSHTIDCPIESTAENLLLKIPEESRIA